MNNLIFSKLFNSKLLLLIILFLFSNTNLIAQTTVNSLSELLPYLSANNENVKLAPGTYTIDNSNVADFNNTIFLFQGNNNIYDFTGVTINFNTEIFSAFGNVTVKEIVIVGNNNVLKNLTMVDVGSVYDSPRRNVIGIDMQGQDNRIEGFNMTVVGSQPYGYGDAFGKGIGYVIKPYKHSAIRVGGDRIHIKNCNIIHRAYGHGIFMQGAVDTLIEDIYLEGEVQTTDAMLGGAYGGGGVTGADLNWITRWGYALPAGHMMSLQEDGIRAYNNGTTIINGVTIEDRRTANITVLNSTVKNMRSGFNLGYSSGTKYVEGCKSIGCETGFNTGTSQVVNCYSDAAYGPAYKNTFNTTRDFNAVITIIPPTDGYYNGSNCLAYIGGKSHEVTLKNEEPNVNPNLEIMMAGYYKSVRFLGEDPGDHTNHTSNDINLTNYTEVPIVITAASLNNAINTCGTVTDNGSSNSVSELSNCSCLSYVSNINPPENLVSGIRYSYYEGTWNALPDFDSLSSIATGTTSSINLNATNTSTDYFGYNFEGYIYIASTGEYTFYTTSSDGSGLWINNNQVVNNDGVHETRESSGKICLESGYHEINVTYFKNISNNTLSVAYEGPDVSKQNIFNLYYESEPLLNIEDKLKWALDITPNPFSETLNILNKENSKMHVEIINSIGQIELSTYIHSEISNLDLSQLTNGLYFIKITNTNNEVQIKKLIKK